jgi:hypothetical protein
MSIKNVLGGALMMCAAVAGSTQAVAADYPDRPIKLLIGFGAGGSTDNIARYYAMQLNEILGEARRLIWSPRRLFAPCGRSPLPSAGATDLRKAGVQD